MTVTSGIWTGVTGFLLGVVVTLLVVHDRAAGRSSVMAIADALTPQEPSVIQSIGPAPAPDDCSDLNRKMRTSRTPPSDDDAVAYFRRQTLLLPLAGVSPKDLRSSFSERRGSSRTHEAIDILAPRNTPVQAVDDGCVARLFKSNAGGLTLYQFDPTLTYTYYYAHLERYATGIEEGDPVRRGEVVGYVGTSGNAPPDTPHLHFAIFILGMDKRWWEGTPIDPYDVWKAD